MSDAEESGWVIERGDSQPSMPLYFGGAHNRHEASLYWSGNSLEAIRFARREDGVRMNELIDSIYGKRMSNRVCEHIWR